MGAAKRILTLATILAAACSLASGYYNWVYFANRTGPFNPVPLRFDLNALPAGTVSYIISQQGPGAVMPGDSFTAIVSEIQAAASVWNGVSSSAIRVQFGGVGQVGTAQATPGIDVVFDDNMPPGILAQTRPMAVDDVSFVAGGNASFVPILRSRVQFRHDLTNPPQASYDDSFFLTAVHELGHALGLQHTMTSGVMSTAVTRATTKAAPLAPDDVAGISVLYPTGGFLAGTGTISGQVTQGGKGVNLASVVALSAASGVAISGMTNPDGTYQILGIPPGIYCVYAHPLPPAQQGEATPANVVWPVDATKTPFAANTAFGTQFFPGTTDWTQASQLNVMAGIPLTAVNFSVPQRAGPAVSAMQTYAYQGAVAVPSPPLQSGTRTTMVFYANGTVVNNNLPAPGLNVSAIGGTALVEPGSLKYYTQGFLMMTVDANPVAAATPAALAVTLNNDLYVLPVALSVVPEPPPAISSVSEGFDNNGNRFVTVQGSNLESDTRIVFDGAPATTLRSNPDGSLVVAPPTAAGGYSAGVEALNSDSQTSSQALGSALPPQFVYDAAAPPTATLRTPSAPAGIDTMVEIDGVNTNFVNGQTAVGFGSSDITVLGSWVTAPGRLLLNLSVSPQAQPGPVTMSVISGLETVPLSAGFQVSAPNPNQVSLRAPIVSLATGQAIVPAGSFALISAPGLPQNLAGWNLTIGSQRVLFSSNGPGQIVAQVPAGLPVGPAVVQLSSPSVTVPPVVLEVDPPAILSAVNGASVAIDGSHPAHPGDLVQLTVFGFADYSNQALLSGVQINVGGVIHGATSVALSQTQPSAYTIQFVLSPNVPSGQQTPVTVGFGTRVSAAYSLAVRNP